MRPRYPRTATWIARSPGFSSTTASCDLARDRDRIPLIERAKFLAIFSSNLDEFFMVRIAGLKRRIAAGVAVPTVTGKMPGELHSSCWARWLMWTSSCC